MMSDRWSVFITLGAVFLLVITSLAPSPAWSVDLSVREDTLQLTPADQIAKNRLSSYKAASQQTEGEMAVTAIQNLGSRTQQKLGMMSVRQEIPISMSGQSAQIKQNTTAPTFAVFPVMVHSAKDKAFSDLPVLLSSAVANKLSERLQKEPYTLGVINPVYAYDDLREKGLDGLYQKIVRDYLEAGQPNEHDLIYLSDQLNAKGRRVDWIVFVQAELDMNHMGKPSGLENIFYHIHDRLPAEPNYFVKGVVQIYSTQAGVPLVWSHESSSKVKMGQFGNFTRSVYDESDSAMSFKTATNGMAQRIVSSIPPSTYQTVSSVQATLVNDTKEAPANISPADQEALKRVLEN